MQNEPVHILLADEHENGRLIFIQAFEEIKINIIVKIVENKVELINHFIQPHVILPHVVILEKNLLFTKLPICDLIGVKKTTLLDKIPIAVYSNSVPEKEIEKDMEEVLAKGANIYIKKPHNVGVLKSVLSTIIKHTWHYHHSGLNKDNFMLSL